MSFTIRDPQTDKLARELARETGETITLAVKQAIRQRLEQVRQNKLQQTRQHKKKATAEEIMEIGRRFAKQVRGKPVDHDALLYDEYGLPK